jgi:hypothetical protein
MVASPGPPAAAAQLFPAAGAAQPLMQQPVYPPISIAPAGPNVIAGDLGRHKATIYRAERAGQARLALPMLRAPFVEQHKPAAHGPTTRETDCPNLLPCVNGRIRRNDANTPQWMVNERNRVAEQSGKTETQHAMKLDNKATKPSFRATPNCPLCQESTDELVRDCMRKATLRGTRPFCISISTRGVMLPFSEGAIKFENKFYWLFTAN